MTLPLSLGRAIGHMRFLPFGVRDRLLRLFFPPGQRMDFAFETELDGARFAGNLDNYIDWRIFFYGSYEAYLLAFTAQLLRQLSPRPSVWDVGANCGQHSLFFAAQGAHVEAFEPLPLVRQKLERNVALNPTLSIAIHPHGLGEAPAILPFTPPDNENLATGHFSSAGTLQLSIVRGDDVAAPPPDLLKIDVEGFEGAVLRGLAATLARHRPIILCEFSERTKELDPDLRRLLPQDYQSFNLLGAERPRLVPYTGAGTGEMVLMLPVEKRQLVERFASLPNTARAVPAVSPA